MRWDVFCRVIDNHGDLGVCWRLAADLAARGERVRLHVDDASALVWMAPEGAPNVQVCGWDAAADPAEVVVEAFGCDPPEDFVRAMAARAVPPVWINLEYLSAESFVERVHGLASPQLAGAGFGLTKWFFYPGFGAATGGLIREPDLAERRRGFDAQAWLAARGWARRDGETVVSLFCYHNPALGDLLGRLAEQPTLLLLTPGPAAQQVRARLGPGLALGALRGVALPWLSQPDFDHLLWSSDLNFVRGEDSFVRALWAARPFVWQIYPQHDGAHVAKLDAFIDRFTRRAEPVLAGAMRQLFLRWNGLSDAPLEWPAEAPWRAHVEAWCGALAAESDLVNQLLGFVHEKQ